MGFSAEDRTENIRRIGEVAKLFADAGIITITSFISPYRADRDQVRTLHAEGELPFYEVYVDCSLEEAEKRDHRKLGKQMDLFHFQDEAPGMVFWHDRGFTLYRTVENYMRDKIRAHGYQEVSTPQVLDRKLWEKSGHWDKFGDMIFATQSENREYAI